MIARDRLRTLVADHADLPEADDAPLVMDSLALVELVEALEDECGVRITAKEVTREHFGSIERLLGFLGTKR